MRLSTSIMADAAASAAQAARGATPDKFASPTPCSEWEVRSLANHLLQVATALTFAGREGAIPPSLWQADLISDDWAWRLDRQMHEAIEAWADPQSWDRTVKMDTAEMPAAIAATMFTSDLVIHSWDLARATGQDYACGDDTAEMALEFVTAMGEQGRGMGIFLEPVPVAEQAPALEKALGLSGRDPGWNP
ncbi:MAG TPA: TIGR03086 family metal-binding protein [Candidatus Limnocylindrales bacterium]